MPIKQAIRTVKNNGDIVLSNILDSYTGESVEYIKVSDPTGITPDGVIYRQLTTVDFGTEVFIRTEFLTNNVIKSAWFPIIGDGLSDDTTGLSKMFIYSKNKRIIFDQNKTYVSTVKLTLLEGGSVDLNGSSLRFDILTGNNKQCLVADDYTTIENGSIELKHSVPGTTAISGEYLAPITIGTFQDPLKRNTNVIVRNLKLKTNCKGILVSALGVKNSIFENLYCDGGGYVLNCIQHHWSNAKAITAPYDGTIHVDPVKRTYAPFNNIIKNIEAVNGNTVDNNSFVVYLSGTYNTIVENIKCVDGTYDNCINLSIGDYGAYAAPDEEKPLILHNHIIKNITFKGNAFAVGVNAIPSATYVGTAIVPIGSAEIKGVVADTIAGASVFAFRLENVEMDDISVVTTGTNAIQITNGTLKAVLANINITGGTSSGVVFRGLAEAKLSFSAKNLRIANTGSNVGGTTQNRVNIECSSNVDSGRITNATLGGEASETALNNISFVSSANNITLDNIIINRNAGGFGFNSSITTMLAAVASRVIIKNVEYRNGVQQVNQPKAFLADFSRGIPTFRMPSATAKESTNILGTLVLHTNPDVSAYYGSILVDTVANTWKNFAGVDNTTDVALDFPSIPAGGYADLTTPITGAIQGRCILIGVAGLEAGMIYTGYCVANGIVTVRATNHNAVAVDPANKTIRIKVFN